MIQRGELWWADLGESSDETGHRPARRRPVLVVQSDPFNSSRLPTVVVVAVTTNLRLAKMPGNVLLPAEAIGLSVDSVANLSQIVTLNRWELTERAGQVDFDTMRKVDEGLRTVLGV